jgi:predicted metal-dependent phosphoesterase TrpH
MIDLHIHTEHSRDADQSVKTILTECGSRKIETIALTDHNLTSADSEGLQLAPEYGIEVIPGIEIDTVFGGTIFHLLGYFIEYDNPEFKALYRRVNIAELDVFPKMIDCLNDLGFAISWEEVLSEACGKMPSEAMIARLIVSNPANKVNPLVKPFLEGGARSNMPYFNFYFDYLAPGKPAFVLREYISLGDAVKLIKRRGGVPVLAHPGSNLVHDDHNLPGIIDSGIKGIEAFSSYHDGQTNQYYADIAKKAGLLITCGSDFHGPFKPAISLGGHGCTLSQDKILHALKACAGR